MSTGEALYWVASLLLAMSDLPDFTGWFSRMADFVERIARKNERGP